jgi:hypothetical protein
MSVDDFRTNAFVRQVLSRFWIDFHPLRYGVVDGIVYLQGRFEKVRPPDPDAGRRAGRAEWVAEDLALLEAVEREIRRERLVGDVIFRLDNFCKSDGKWTPIGA